MHKGQALSLQTQKLSCGTFSTKFSGLWLPLLRFNTYRMCKAGKTHQFSPHVSFLDTGVHTMPQMLRSTDADEAECMEVTSDGL